MDYDKVKKIAVVVSALDEEYQYNILRGINRFAIEKDLNISYFAAFGGMVESKRFDLGEYSIYNLIDYSKFDGILFMINTFGDADTRLKIINRVKSANKPTVVFESKENEDFYNICIDNFSVMKKLVNHIIQFHEAKTLNCITGPLANPEARSRYDAFCAAMEENGLKVEEERVFFGNFRSYDGKQAIDKFIASGLPMPDAIICANDSMALTAVSSLEKLGYKVPDDVMVTGFDNTFNARNSYPALTTVKRPLEQAGYTACSILYNLLEGIEQPKCVTLEATPVYSDSCGCCAEAGDNLREYKKITYKKIEDTNNYIHALNRLAAGLAEAETATAAYNVMKECVSDLDLDKFCLCLSENWKESFSASHSVFSESGYSKYMTAPFIWDKGECRSKMLFQSRDMYPDGFGEGGDISYFLPLHFGDRCLGYYIITNSDFPTSSLLCHTLTMTLSNSIENIRKLYHLNKAMDELNRLYVIDPLCNIYNRNGFMNITEDMFKECAANKSRVMISFIDMDGLKFINDTYGHNEGDFAIQRLASVIRECCGTKYIGARFGGDEFVILGTNVQESDADELSKRFNNALKNINAIIQKPYTLSASIGSIVIVPQNSDTLHSIINQADNKMYEIKKQKKTTRKNEIV